jgi:uncharacterized protein with HEPN domain
MPRDDLYLMEIIEACNKIALWLSDVDLDRWSEDEVLRNAVVHNLILIGEAARAVSAELCERHPAVEWREAAAFRNRAIHEYFSIEWPKVWSIARQDAPAFGRQVRAVLSAEFPDLSSACSGRSEAAGNQGGASEQGDRERGGDDASA